VAKIPGNGQNSAAATPNSSASAAGRGLLR
jgi:hypothetical protein